MTRHNGFSLLELVAIIVVLVAVAILFIPAMSRHNHAPQMQNNTQLRGIHQAMIMYAQGNNGHFPGLNPDGTDADLSVENRLWILLDGNYFTGDYAISPVEVKTTWTTGPVTTVNYSFAMLQIPAVGGRRTEWSNTLNPDAAALADRPVGTAAAPLSIWARSAPHIQRRSSSRRSLSCWWHGCGSPYTGTGWRGSVVYNDNHVVFQSTSTLQTQYGSGAHNRADELFTAAGDDDALMVHRGN